MLASRHRLKGITIYGIIVGVVFGGIILLCVFGYVTAKIRDKKRKKETNEAEFMEIGARERECFVQSSAGQSRPAV